MLVTEVYMSHPYEDRSMKFTDMEKMIVAILSGQIKREEVSEKIDGQNLFASIIDGHIRFSRNKTNIKNKGAQSMSIADMKAKWKDNPSVQEAFVESAKELEKALLQLPKKELDEIFENGRNWINIEIVWAGNKNVIDYDGSSIVIHNLNVIEDDGSNAGIPDNLQKKLFNLIKKVEPGKLKVKTPIMLQIKPDVDFSAKKDIYIKKINAFRTKQKVGKNKTLEDWLNEFWEKKLTAIENKFKHKLDPKVKKKLINRLSNFDKSYKIPQIKKDIGFVPVYTEFKKLDDDATKITKEATKPLEIAFLQLGAEVMKNIDTYLTANPDKTIQSLRKDIASRIKAIKSANNMDDLSKMRELVRKVQAVGGFDSIVPTEGIVFKWNDKVYKLTGVFAPINQLLGLGRYNR